MFVVCIQATNFCVDFISFFFVDSISWTKCYMSFKKHLTRKKYIYIYSSTKRTIWLILFLFISFISFTYLIALAKTSSTILNSNGLSIFSFSWLELNCLSLSPFKMILTIGLLNITFVIKQYVFHIPRFSRTLVLRDYWI